VLIVAEEFYNTDGYGLILIVEREDHWFAEAANPEGPFVDAAAAEAVLPGTAWMQSPNAVIEAWFQARGAHGPRRRPNRLA
jgi:hypothetical protein